MKKAADLFLLIFLSLIFLATAPQIQAQHMIDDTLPYRKIPDAPEVYSSTNTVARMIDGLGYRYYWATKGLRTQDLEFRISEDSRTSFETLKHIHGLSKTILNAVQGIPNQKGQRPELDDFGELRAQTLNNLAQASEILKEGSDENIDKYNIIFKRGEEESKYPFWNLINGMISDAIWHAGQIVSFRRASGNPIHPGVSVLRGVTRE